LLATLLLLTSGCDTNPEAKDHAHDLTQGNPDRAPALITHYGCAACHSIPGIRFPRTLVGPPLDRFATRTFIAGSIQNTPDHLIPFLKDPHSVNPQTSMPNIGVTDSDARDIAAYLYTLR
jgi:cytochrome c1